MLKVSTPLQVRRRLLLFYMNFKYVYKYEKLFQLVPTCLLYATPTLHFFRPYIYWKCEIKGLIMFVERNFVNELVSFD